MCLIAWDWQPESNRPLLLLANRDEFYARPTLPLHWWENQSVLAGQDLQAGGTWLGLSRTGRLAALTNFRQATPDRSPRPSRGGLVAEFLQSNADARDYCEALVARAHLFNPFNLLVFDGKRLIGLESRHQKVLALPSGIGGVSNADFNTPWPKLQRLKAMLAMHSQSSSDTGIDLLKLLRDRRQAPDAELPDTGIALSQERLLSACWIHSSQYGTRASSIVSWSPQQVSFFEQGYDAHGLLQSTQQSFVPHLSG